LVVGMLLTFSGQSLMIHSVTAGRTAAVDSVPVAAAVAACRISFAT
jgi:hypothetical protein